MIKWTFDRLAVIDKDFFKDISSLGIRTRYLNAELHCSAVIHISLHYTTQSLQAKGSIILEVYKLKEVLF